MMNPKGNTDHKILGKHQSRHSSRLSATETSAGASEGGYALVALLALMTLMALFAMAAAPGILQQAQREQEKEAIFRGEEVAGAIKEFYKAQKRNRPGSQGDSALPTEIDQLLEGVTIPGRTKKLQILRASAAHDPLSRTGEWRLIRPHSSKLADFQRDVILYAGNVLPPTTDSQLQADIRLLAPPVMVISGLTSTGSLSDDSDVDVSTGPFVGVSSYSKRSAVITYYGIDHHNQWVFTPLFR